MSSQDSGVTGPELAVDRSQLRQVAKANLADKAYQWPDGRKMVTIEILIDEVRKITGMLWGEEVISAEIQARIIQTLRVVQGAHRGEQALAGATFVSIDIQ